METVEALALVSGRVEEELLLLPPSQNVSIFLDCCRYNLFTLRVHANIAFV